MALGRLAAPVASRGWLLLLVSFLGAIEQIINRDLLHLMLDLYILACSLLTVLLELEINSRLIRRFPIPA